MRQIKDININKYKNKKGHHNRNTLWLLYIREDYYSSSFTIFESLNSTGSAFFLNFIFKNSTNNENAIAK